MLTLDEFTLWLQQMGYYKDLPTNLNQIWNRQTAHIFQQIVINARPKNDIDVARKNIIIDRLKHKESVLKHDLYPYERIEIFEENQKLERQIDVLKYCIAENDNKLEQIVKNNNNEYVKIEVLKQEIVDNKEKLFVLHKKHETIQQHVDEVENMINAITKQTTENNQFNSNEIDMTLKDCVVKLEKINQKYKNNMPNLDKTLNITTITRKSSYPSSISYYLSTPATNKKLSMITPTSNRRESLGLLPNSCLSELDDVFIEQSSSSLLTTTTARCLFPNNSIKSICSETNNSNYFDNFLLEKLTKNYEINNNLKQLLNNNNHSLIFKLWEDQFSDLLVELNNSYLKLNNILENHYFNDSRNDNSIELYYNHVHNEIIILNQLKQIKDSQDLIDQQNNKLQIVDYQLDKQIRYLQEKKDSLQKQQLSSSLLLSSNSYNLQKIHEQINTINKQISFKKFMIDDNILQINRLIDLIKMNCNEINFNLEKFNNFVFDENWFLTLINNCTLTEIENLIKFPLQYYKTNSINNSSNDTVKLLSTLEYYLNDETIIANQIRSKTKLDLLKSLLNHDTDGDTVNSQNKLVVESSFIDQFNEMESVERHLGKRLDLLFTTIKRSVELWSDLPFGDYLSEDRQINGNSYKFYKKLLENRPERM